MSLLSPAPRSIGGVLDDAIRLYRKSLRSVWPLTLGAVVLTSVPGFIVASKLEAASAAGLQAIIALIAQPSYWAGLIVIWFIYLTLSNALISHIDGIARGKAPSLSQSIHLGCRRAAPMFAVTFLLGLMSFIGLIFLVVPGIYLLGIFQLASIALIVENAGVFEAFGISQRLIKGYWWRSATILTVGVVILMVFGVLAALAGGILTGLLGSDRIGALFFQQLASSVVNVFMLSLLPSIMLSMYYDLKLRHEGADLSERVDALHALR